MPAHLGSRPNRREWGGLLGIFVLVALAFRHAATAVVIALAAWVIHRIVVRRDRRVLACVISTGLSLTVFEFVGGKLLERQIAEMYNVDMDHRLKPDPAHGINTDGIRCPVEASDFAADTFNIIVLGDSFTYGQYLDDARDAFPAQLEELLRQRDPAMRARVVNFGWPSSSPLLTYRLLRDIGAKYKPKLVIQCLDMSDFHDDLRYRESSGLGHLSPTRYLMERAGLVWIWSEVRDDCRFTGDGPAIPAERYFITNQPLEKSLPFMRETELNLMRINALCTGQLHAPFLVVMMPRGFQYSDRESPRNWEAPRYTVHGPWAEEPFRWLEGLKTRVPFKCESLLDDFKRSGVFPTCFDHDPHWNRAGHAVAARGLLRVLKQAGYVRESD